MVLALPDLIVIALAFFLLAFAWTARKMVRALFSPLVSLLGSVPGIGSALSNLIHTIEQAVTNACGALYAGADALLGGAWHQLAKLLSWAWREFRSHAHLIEQLATIAGALALAWRGIEHGLRDLTKRFHGISHGIRDLTRQWHGIERRVKSLERVWTKGIGHDLRIHVKALERELGHVETKVIPDIRSIANTAESDVTALQKWIARNVPVIGTKVFTDAIAAALAALGFGWLGCRSNPFNNNKNACGLWNDLSNLFGWFADLFFVTSLCDVIGPLETAFSDVAAPAISLLTSAIDDMPCVSGNQPPALTVPTLALPPTPGVSLSLP